MTILYVPVISLERAEELSSLLWELTNPNLDKETKFYSSPITHPSTGNVMLPVESEQFPIHINANKHLFDDFLQIFVDGGVITFQDVFDVQSNIDANRGNKVNLQDMLPSVWFRQLVDEQYLEANGWFDNSEIIEYEII